MEITGYSADGLYKDLWWAIKTSGLEMDSRNGSVVTIPEPVLAVLKYPMNRVLFNSIRDANPFFHVAEVVWMFSGSRDVSFIKQFNNRYAEYAEDNGLVHGAYGHRWLNHFGMDQITFAIGMLKDNPGDRRVVINMWDPAADLGENKRDLPCNTQILPRVVGNKLDLLVVNRSNDMVWGMMGANIVHFTYLQELFARSLGVEVGSYRVVTNNLHVYPGMPRYESIREAGLHTEPAQKSHGHFPLLWTGETWEDLQMDCYNCVKGERKEWTTKWMTNVAGPIVNAYLAGPHSSDRRGHWRHVSAPDWSLACDLWMKRRGH